MKRSILSLTGTLFSVSLLIAQNSAVLDINNLHMRFNSSGHISVDPTTSQPGCEIPAGSGVHAMYAAGLWMGGVDPGSQLHLAAQTYGQAGGDDFWPGPLTIGGAASTTPAISQQYDQVWTVLRSEVLDHIAYFDCVNDPSCDAAVQFPNYMIPQSFFDWPAHGNTAVGLDYHLLTFIESNESTNGFYEPNVGDHPCFQGDKSVHFIFNDQKVHGLSGGLPIGLEIRGMAYAYNTLGPALDNTVFVHYTIINRSTLTLQGTLAGIFADFDLGNYNDDYVGTDVERALMYAYNGDNLDEAGSSSAGYGQQPPAFGVTVLQGPFQDADAIDNPLTSVTQNAIDSGGVVYSASGLGYGDGIVDNERIGLRGSRYFSGSGGALGDPSTGDAAEHFRQLEGRWNDGSQQLYGGSGHISDPNADPTQPASFAYPGTSDPLGFGTNGVPQPSWTESALPGDRKMLGSMGPFTLEPGAYNWIDLAFVYARANNGGPQASVQALLARVDSVREFFNTELNIPAFREDPWCPDAINHLYMSIDGNSKNGAPVSVYPTPATDRISISMMDHVGSSTGYIHDLTGKLVRTVDLVGPITETSVRDLDSGVYVLRIETERGAEVIRFVRE